MTQAESGARRAWVGFSALAFAICGVLLLVQFSGRLARPAPPAQPAAKQSPGSLAITTPHQPPQPPPTRPLPPPETGPDHDLPRKSDGKKTDGAKKALLPRTEPAGKQTGAKTPEGNGAFLGSGTTLGTTKVGTLGHGLSTGSAKPRELTKTDRKEDSASAGPALTGPGTAVGTTPATLTDPGPARPALQAAEEKLTEGVLKVNVPPTMTVGQSDHVRAVVGAKLHIDLVDKEASLETNDGARVQIGRDLMISSLVRMELHGDNAGEFDINALAPEATQRINDNDATVWEWSVTPKLEGLRGLTLVVSDLKEGSREPIRTKIYPVHIEVRVTAWQRVRDITVAGSSVLSGLAGLIGAWMGLLRPLLQRRRPEGEPGTPPPRPPLAAAPPPPQPTSPAAESPATSPPPPTSPAAAPAAASPPPPTSSAAAPAAAASPPQAADAPAAAAPANSPPPVAAPTTAAAPNQAAAPSEKPTAG